MFSAETVRGFAVVAGVAQERGKPLASVGVPDGGRKLAVVRFGTPVHHQAQDQVAVGVAEGRKLGITGLVVGAVAAATPGEVVRDVMRFQPGRIDGGQAAGGRDQAEVPRLVERGVEEPRKVVFFSSRRSA